MTTVLPIRRSIALACLVFVVTVGCRWALRFDGFGEHDQARFLCDAILYRYEGAGIFRKYFLITSPLALVAFSAIDAAAGHAALLPISNMLAVLASGVTAVAAYRVALALLGRAAWAASAAVGASVVPGVFFTSLYGYPSVYALALLATSTAALAAGVSAEPARKRRLGLAACGAAFAAAVLCKTDFALMGTWLLAVALQCGRREDRARNVAFLIGLALATAALTYGVTALLLRDPHAPLQFGRGWVEDYEPYRVRYDAFPIVQAAGRGSLVLLCAGCALVALRRGAREGAMLLAGCLLAAGPLWWFWASIPPLSTRHCLPGALVAGLYAGVAAAKAFPRARALAVLWPLVLVAGNWWGRPSFDLNYHLSGKLVGQYRTNRAAFAAAQRVADEIAADPRPVQVWVGRPASPAILGRIDIIEMVRYRLACGAVEVRNPLPERSEYDLYARRPDGSERFLFDARLDGGAHAASFLGRTRYPKEQYRFLSMTLDHVPAVEAIGLPLTRYDLRAAYEGKAAAVPPAR
jgi:hypothetical protein